MTSICKANRQTTQQYNIEKSIIMISIFLTTVWSHLSQVCRWIGSTLSVIC